MKRLIAFLSVLLCAPAYADGFGPSDKVLYFNSETLIAVIKDTFPQNLQLDVANKYVELMDSKGNVSIDDLIAVCGVGQLDNVKCKNFIRDLINTMGDDTIKPFYWADYVTVNPEPIRLAVFSSGDGYHKNAGLDSGEWAITFGWMKESNFMRQYPQTKYIRGISACTNESGTQNIADASKNFALNEQSGEQCWCKMVGPEESAWVYTKGDGMAGGCARSCALECISALRTEPMRGAMFTAVKLNGSNANTNDEKVIGDALITAVTPPPPPKPKPCTFDWAKDTAVENVIWNDDIWYGWKSTSKEENANGLDYGEWAFGGLSWMKNQNFKCKYPNVNQIKGISSCNHEQSHYGDLTNKDFTDSNMKGLNCWCKITYPEKSSWFFVQDFEAYIGCEHMCPYFCAFAFPIFINYHNCGGEALKSIGKK